MATLKGGNTSHAHGSFASSDRVWGEIHPTGEPGSPVPARQDSLDVRLDPATRSSLTACDLLGTGLVVCDQQGRIVAANRSAISIIRTGNALTVTSDGLLSISREVKSPQPSLQELVAHALEGKKPSAIVIPRSTNEPALTVIVRERVHDAATRLPGDPVVFVLILDPSLSATPGAEKAREVYGLTSTELHLAELLMDGRSLNECCDQLAISLSKGRQHLQGLFRKTGVRRQSHLIALLLEYIPAQRRLSEDLVSSLSTPDQVHRRRSTAPGTFMRHRR